MAKMRKCSKSVVRDSNCVMIMISKTGKNTPIATMLKVVPIIANVRIEPEMGRHQKLKWDRINWSDGQCGN